MGFDLQIKGGTVVDPANGVHEEIRDLWISNGQIVASPDPDARALRTLDARGYVVMPGGVDVHCHIAGSKVNAARGFRPEIGRESFSPHTSFPRSGGLGITPTTSSTGYLYAGLGYTSAVDASIAPLAARQAHHEFADTPLIDKAFLVLLGNNHFLMDRIHDGDHNAVRDAVAWLLGAAKGFGVKVVNPGGVERWKEGKGNIVTIDDSVDTFGVTPHMLFYRLIKTHLRINNRPHRNNPLERSLALFCSYLALLCN